MKVGETASNRRDDIFGWLLESAGAGGFTDAMTLFGRAMDLLKQLDISSRGEHP